MGTASLGDGGHRHRDGGGGSVRVLEGWQVRVQHPWGMAGTGVVSMSLRDGRGGCSVLGGRQAQDGCGEGAKVRDGSTHSSNHPCARVWEWVAETHG